MIVQNSAKMRASRSKLYITILYHPFCKSNKTHDPGRHLVAECYILASSLRLLQVCKIALCVCRILLRQHLKCWWCLLGRAVCCQPPSRQHHKAASGCTRTDSHCQLSFLPFQIRLCCLTVIIPVFCNHI